jgi:FAD/FMN-containing dehydrogenase
MQCDSQARARRVWAALHTSGDGNVHTNLPVNSDDYEMRRVKPRDEAVARIMVLARSLDGVISASTASASPSHPD